MSYPTPRQINWYINWYNNLPIAKKNPPEKWGTRSICPYCREPIFAKKDDLGEVVMDIDHKPDCSLYNEYQVFEKEHPDLSPGMVFLAWNRRNDK